VGWASADATVQVLDAGWRGRAQQIVMLKAKVRKLEGQLAEGGSAAASESGKEEHRAGVDRKVGTPRKGSHKEEGPVFKRVLIATSHDFEPLCLTLSGGGEPGADGT
jgi:hypothetical protein